MAIIPPFQSHKVRNDEKKGNKNLPAYIQNQGAPDFSVPWKNFMMQLIMAKRMKRNDRGCSYKTFFEV